MRLIAALSVAALMAPLACAADNALTPGENKAGWKLLFDGKTFRGWRDPAKETPPGDAWVVENGCLKTQRKARISEDLISAESYGDFELKFDWRISPGGNTGVKYRLQREVFIDNTKTQPGPGGWEGIVGREMANPRSDRAKMAPAARGQVYTISFEFQLLDDERHPDAKKDSSHTNGALYSMIPPAAKAAKPAGEWNEGRLVLKGNHFEHWINGVRVLEGSLDAPQAQAGIRKRWAPAPAVADLLLHAKQNGPVSLQHHGDEVWFKNVKIRPL